MQIKQVNIHDAFFKSVLSNSEMADAFLREHLPREVAELLAPQPPEQISGSFVDEELAQHHTDLLFRLRLKTDDDALAYVLVEHKSAPDKLARLQLLRYIARFLEDWYEKHKRLPLPLVMPMLAHQGPGGWKIATDFGELFGAVPEAWRPYLISFRHALVDLARIEHGALSGNLRLRSHLRALKYAQRKDLPKQFDLILIDSPALTVQEVVGILDYLARGPVVVRPEIFQDALRRLEPSRQEQIMASFGASFFDRGLAEGEARGEAKGQATALVRLLKKRFSRLPPHLHKRISAADVMSIEVWFDRAIDAPDLKSVFGAEARSRPQEHETH